MPSNEPLYCDTVTLLSYKYNNREDLCVVYLPNNLNINKLIRLLDNDIGVLLTGFYHERLARLERKIQRLILPIFLGKISVVLKAVRNMCLFLFNRKPQDRHMLIEWVTFIRLRKPFIRKLLSL